MRSDSGDIQYDGFEYNWYFRTKGWRSQVGRLNFGGWVRRRRWVRLMMRPGKNPREKEDILPTDRWDGPYVKRNSIASSFPPSILTRASDIPDEFFAIDVDEVWQGDKLDFLRCRTVMKQLGRDGKKLEVWKKWVGLGESIVIRKQQWTEDEVYGDPDPEPSEPSEPAEPSAVRSKTDVPIAHIANVLRTHVRTFILIFFAVLNCRMTGRRNTSNVCLSRLTRAAHRTVGIGKYPSTAQPRYDLGLDHQPGRFSELHYGV